MENEFMQRALKLHKEKIVVDAHLDLPGEILHRKNNGEHDIVRKIYSKHWENAGVNLIVASVFVESALLPEMGLRNALNQITALKEEISSNDRLMLVTNARELERVIAGKYIGIILYVEGLDFIGNDISLLDVLFDLGVRGAALTWSRDNLLACGCCKASESVQRHGGLTGLGMKVVERLEQLKMFVDVSHLNDDGFEELNILTKRPFVATHSCSREVYFHYRNLTDGQLKKIADRGGVIGINGCRMIAGVEKNDNPFERLCEHIEYICKLVGADAVGLGLDFCDSYDCARYHRSKVVRPDDCLKNYSELPMLTASLLSRGMSEKDVTGILGGNFANYLRKNLPE